MPAIGPRRDAVRQRACPSSPPAPVINMVGLWIIFYWSQPEFAISESCFVKSVSYRLVYKNSLNFKMNSTAIAYFVTDHGFGHASRSAAVMAALLSLQPGLRFEIFTACPKWIFDDALQTEKGTSGFGYHGVKTDLGLIQASPLEEDLDATCLALDRWLPFDPDLVDGLAMQLTALGCQLVVCDISPLGIAAAHRAALPSVLVENFTWDWIYASYSADFPRLAVSARILNRIYQQVDLRIQTEPLCADLEGRPRVNPIFRWPRADRQEVRSRLGISSSQKMVLVSMGGVPDRFDFLTQLSEEIDPFIVIPGADGLNCDHPKVILLPTHSSYYHPDLLNAADAVIGKAGYSTIAEACHAGIPYGYILRHKFPESVHLERFITIHMPCLSIAPEDYYTGRWIGKLPALLTLEPARPLFENGAFQTAQLLLDKFVYNR